MELDTLKPFIKHTVEVLVGGVWIEGVMTPIVKGVVTLLPLAHAKDFYGPTAMKAEVIQAVRQIKVPVDQLTPPPAPNPTGQTVRSSLESMNAMNRFVRK